MSTDEAPLTVDLVHGAFPDGWSWNGVIATAADTVGRLATARAE